MKSGTKNSEKAIKITLLCNNTEKATAKNCPTFCWYVLSLMFRKIPLLYSFLSKMHQPENISFPWTGNKLRHLKGNSQLVRTFSILAQKTTLFYSYIIHFHTVTEDVKMCKKVGLVIVGGCIPRRDTGAQRRVRRPRDSLTPGRTDPRQAGRAHTGGDTERERELLWKKKVL